MQISGSLLPWLHSADQVKARGYDLLLLIHTQVKNWKCVFYLINPMVFLKRLMAIHQTKIDITRSFLILLSSMEEKMWPFLDAVKLNSAYKCFH